MQFNDFCEEWEMCKCTVFYCEHSSYTQTALVEQRQFVLTYAKLLPKSQWLDVNAQLWLTIHAKGRTISECALHQASTSNRATRSKDSNFGRLIRSMSMAIVPLILQREFLQVCVE